MLLAFALGAGAIVVAKTIKGTSSGEKLVGSKHRDRIFGGGGDDLINGKGGRDRLRGGPGNDTINGGKGKDKVSGGPGDDILVGGRGNDKIIGGPGRDEIGMRDGVEQGSPGNDVIYARDGQPDEIDCGAGNDKVIVDRVEDGVYDCETVVTP